MGFLVGLILGVVGTYLYTSGGFKGLLATFKSIFGK